MSESTLPPDDLALDEAAIDAMLSGTSLPADPIGAVLDALRAEASRLTPEPSAALAELFATGLARDELARRRNRARIVVGMLLAGGTTLGLSGVAAAHDALPAPAQSVVTDIVNDLTPFHIAADDRFRVPSPTDTAPHPRTGVRGDGDRRTDGTRDDSGRSDDGGRSGPGGSGPGRSSAGTGTSRSGDSGSGGSDSGSGGDGGTSGSGSGGGGSSGGSDGGVSGGGGSR